MDGGGKANPGAPFRQLIDDYKSGRALWEAAGKAEGGTAYRKFTHATERLAGALNASAGVSGKRHGEEPSAAVLDDDGTLYLVVDNGWGQLPTIDAFTPFRPGDLGWTARPS